MASQQSLMNEQGLYDIYGAWHIPFWQTKQFYLFLTCIAAVGIVLLLWYAIRRYRSRPVLLSPQQRALQQLQALKKNNRATVVAAKEFYSTVTRVLKDYVYERYGYDTYDKTDVEFLHYLEDKEFPANLLTDLQAIFSGSEIIKFANAQAIQDQIESDLDKALSFVNRTSVQLKM